MPKLSDKKIVQLAQRPDGFSVTWKWGNDALRSQCIRLMNSGLLVMTYSRGRDDFAITNAGKEFLKRGEQL